MFQLEASLNKLESNTPALNEGKLSQCNVLTTELQRRLDDYESGKEPSYSEEEIRAKVKALLER